MVDIRQEVCGVIVAGTPAPGINGVISAVVIKCLSLDIGIAIIYYLISNVQCLFSNHLV